MQHTYYISCGVFCIVYTYVHKTARGSDMVVDEKMREYKY